MGALNSPLILLTYVDYFLYVVVVCFVASLSWDRHNLGQSVSSV